MPRRASVSFFFFNATATTEIYTLSLHDALPIYLKEHPEMAAEIEAAVRENAGLAPQATTSAVDKPDRKITRLNSSHTDISRMPSSA